MADHDTLPAPEMTEHVPEAPITAASPDTPTVHDAYVDVVANPPPDASAPSPNMPLHRRTAGGGWTVWH